MPVLPLLATRARVVYRGGASPSPASRHRHGNRGMRYRRVTIIGASGFVGRYVVKDLAQQGVAIAALSRHAADDGGFLRPMGDVGQVAPIEVNILDEPRLEAALAGAEAAVNATGILYASGAQTFE